MKEQLDALAKEMIAEVKNLKDLTKENLPLVAKEYVAFNEVSAILGAVLSLLVFAPSCVGIIHGILNDKMGDRTVGAVQGLSLFGMLIGGFFLLVNIYSYLSFKFQPRTKAIEGVVNAFKVR